MEIEIIGYDLVNGEKQSHKVFKNNIVNSIEEVDKFEQRIKHRYSKKYDEEVQVFAIYKYKPLEQRKCQCK